MTTALQPPPAPPEPPTPPDVPSLPSAPIVRLPNGMTITNDGGTRIIRLPNGKEIILDEQGNVDMEGMTTERLDFRDAVPTGAVQIVAFSMTGLVLCVVGFPIARAIARWIDRRSAAPRVPVEVMTRLANIENAVETVAIEVERISEGQRFTAKLLAERANDRANERMAERIG